MDTGCQKCNEIQEATKDPVAMCDRCHIDWCKHQIQVHQKEIERLELVIKKCKQYTKGK